MVQRLVLVVASSLFIWSARAVADPGGAYAEPSSGLASSTPGRGDGDHVTVPGVYGTRIEIAAPPFHALAPQLALSYSSGAGNGTLGVGWSLSGLSSIRRRSPGDGVPGFDAGDVFYLDDQLLVACDSRLDPKQPTPGCDVTADGSYRYFVTRQESYQRIGFDGVHWLIWQKSGNQLAFNELVTTKSGQVEQWLLSATTDLAGNQVAYHYAADAAPTAVNKEARYPTEIDYDHHAIKLIWRTRPDQLSSAMGDGTLLWIRKSLAAVSVSTADGARLLRAYQLTYKPL